MLQLTQRVTLYRIYTLLPCRYCVHRSSSGHLVCHPEPTSIARLSSVRLPRQSFNISIAIGTRRWLPLRIVRVVFLAPSALYCRVLRPTVACYELAPAARKSSSYRVAAAAITYAERRLAPSVRL